RLFGNAARRWRCIGLSLAVARGRTMATQSTCSGFTLPSARQVRMDSWGIPPECRRRVSFDSSIAAANSPSFRRALAASPRIPPMPRMFIATPKISFRFLRLLNLRPRVAKRYRTVEDRTVRRRILVHAEVAQPLELVAAQHRRALQRRLHF